MRRRHTPAGDRARPPPVYPAREDTWLLLPFAGRPALGWLLEIGCGEGRASLEAARQGWQVVATDRNPEALATLWNRARREGLEVHPVRSDLASGLGKFARILANPPYLPTRVSEEDPDPWVDLALNGGPDGCRTTARIVDQLADHLAPGGRAYLLTSSIQDPAALRRIFQRWAELGGSSGVVGKRVLEGETLEVVELGMAR